MKVNFLFFLVTKNFESIVPNQEWKIVDLSVFIYLGQDYKYLSNIAHMKNIDHAIGCQKMVLHPNQTLQIIIKMHHFKLILKPNYEVK